MKAAIIYNHSKSYELETRIKKLFEFVPPPEADVIIVIGGDGALLHTIHQYMEYDIPFYGVNAGSLGFLMNHADIDGLVEDLHSSTIAHLHPLKMHVTSITGENHQALAINEVSIFRITNQSAKFKIIVDGIERVSELVADGIMLATPAGSSAYNLSAGGPILPLESNVLCLTPICPFRPRWRGALLPSSALVQFEMLETDKRPINVTADFQEFHNIQSVSIKSVRNKTIKLLFNKNHTLEDRILKEQFSG